MRQAAQSRPHAFVPARSQGMGPEARSVPQKQSLEAVVQKAFPSLPIYDMREFRMIVLGEGVCFSCG